MRLSSSWVVVIAWMGFSAAQAQTAATQPAATPSPPARAALAPLEAAGPSRSSARSGGSRHQPPHRAKGAARRSETASTPAGVALGATDITGNKELPKVMVIVPWKDSLGASGVVKPADSLLDQVLQPVDRGVFQRQIHYYGQLNAAQQRPAAAKVAPVGDSH